MTVRTRIMALVAAALITPFALSACSDSGDDAPSSESAAAAAPDLDGLPDVIAVVDGTEISKDEFVTAYQAQFTQSAARAAQSGEPLDQDSLKQETAESMVNTQLLLAEADDRGYTASQKQIDSTLAELAEQSGLTSPEEFLESLAEQGVDAAEANRQLEGQVKLDQLIEEEGGNADPTDEDLQELYDEVVAQQEASGATTDDLPPFEEVRSQLDDQLRQERENAVAQGLVEDLREDAEITINL